MAIQNRIGIGILSAYLGITSCSQPEDKTEYKTGTVLKESGTIVDRIISVEKSSGALFGNESVKVGEMTYAVQIKTEQGIYNANVISWVSSDLEAIALAIDPGDIVRFRTKYSRGNDVFYSNKIGRLMPKEIDIIKKANDR